MISQLAQHAANSWAWYIVRGAGLTAAVLIVVLMVSGIGLITGLTFRWLEPIKAWAVHRALGIALGVAIVCHVVFLLFDKFVNFNPASLVIPFIASFNPVWTGAGVLAMYCLAAVILTSLLIIDRSRRIWRLVHYASYASVVLVFFHALYTGSDLADGPLRWIWMITGLALIAAIVSRLWRAGTLRPEA